MQFTLNQNDLEPQPIFNLYPGVEAMDGSGATYPPLAIDRRAERVAYGSGGIVSREQAAQTMRISGDGLLRDQAASREEARQWEVRAQAAADGDVNAVMAPPPAVAPEVAIETEYARRLVNDLFFEEGEAPDVTQLNPSEQRAYNITLEAYENAIARDEIIRRSFDQYQEQWSTYNWPTRAWDVIETMIPFKDWLTFSRELNVIPAYNDLRLPGDSLLDQVQHLYRLPIEEFERAFTEGVDAIANVNLSQAFQFISAVQSYSRT